MSHLDEFISDSDPTEIFQLNFLVAKGSYGSVFAGHLEGVGDVAVKIIAIEDEESMEECIIELDILSRCRHENIVGYFGAYKKDDELWIGMEYMDGGAVSTLYLASKTPFEEPVIATVCRETLRGLLYLHNNSIIHRDIKGGNIMVTKSGHVKLVDFGISAVNARHSMKRETVIGTPLWMAPEIIDNTGMPVPYGYKVDIWALGITVIEMAELQPPHFDVNPMRAIFLIPTCEPPVLADQERWTDDMHDFLSLCVIKEPSDRPGTEELLDHEFVQEVLGPEDLAKVVLERTDAQRAKKKSRAARIAAALAAMDEEMAANQQAESEASTATAPADSSKTNTATSSATAADAAASSTPSDPGSSTTPAVASSDAGAAASSEASKSPAATPTASLTSAVAGESADAKAVAALDLGAPGSLEKSASQRNSVGAADEREPARVHSPRNKTLTPSLMAELMAMKKGEEVDQEKGTKALEGMDEEQQQELLDAVKEAVEADDDDRLDDVLGGMLPAMFDDEESEEESEEEEDDDDDDDDEDEDDEEEDAHVDEKPSEDAAASSTEPTTSNAARNDAVKAAAAAEEPETDADGRLATLTRPLVSVRAAKSMFEGQFSDMANKRKEAEEKAAAERKAKEERARQEKERLEKERLEKERKEKERKAAEQKKLAAQKATATPSTTVIQAAKGATDAAQSLLAALGQPVTSTPVQAKDVERDERGRPVSVKRADRVMMHRDASGEIKTGKPLQRSAKTPRDSKKDSGGGAANNRATLKKAFALSDVNSNKEQMKEKMMVKQNFKEMKKLQEQHLKAQELMKKRHADELEALHRAHQANQSQVAKETRKSAFQLRDAQSQQLQDMMKQQAADVKQMTKKHQRAEMEHTETLRGRQRAEMKLHKKRQMKRQKFAMPGQAAKSQLKDLKVLQKKAAQREDMLMTQKAEWETLRAGQQLRFAQVAQRATLDQVHVVQKSMLRQEIVRKRRELILQALERHEDAAYDEQRQIFDVQVRHQREYQDMLHAQLVERQTTEKRRQDELLEAELAAIRKKYDKARKRVVKKFKEQRRRMQKAELQQMRSVLKEQEAHEISVLDAEEKEMLAKAVPSEDHLTPFQFYQQQKLVYQNLLERQKTYRLYMNKIQEMERRHHDMYWQMRTEQAQLTETEKVSHMTQEMRALTSTHQLLLRDNDKMAEEAVTTMKKHHKKQLQFFAGLDGDLGKQAGAVGQVRQAHQKELKELIAELTERRTKLSEEHMTQVEKMQMKHQIEREKLLKMVAEVDAERESAMLQLSGSFETRIAKLLNEQKVAREKQQEAMRSSIPGADSGSAGAGAAKQKRALEKLTMKGASKRAAAATAGGGLTDDQALLGGGSTQSSWSAQATSSSGKTAKPAGADAAAAEPRPSESAAAKPIRSVSSSPRAPIKAAKEAPKVAAPTPAAAPAKAAAAAAKPTGVAPRPTNLQEPERPKSVKLDRPLPDTKQLQVEDFVSPRHSVQPKSGVVSQSMRVEGSASVQPRNRSSSISAKGSRRVCERCSKNKVAAKVSQHGKTVLLCKSCVQEIQKAGGIMNADNCQKCEVRKVAAKVTVDKQQFRLCKPCTLSAKQGKCEHCGQGKVAHAIRIGGRLKFLDATCNSHIVKLCEECRQRKVAAVVKVDGKERRCCKACVEKLQKTKAPPAKGAATPPATSTSTSAKSPNVPALAVSGDKGGGGKQWIGPLSPTADKAKPGGGGGGDGAMQKKIGNALRTTSGGRANRLSGLFTRSPSGTGFAQVLAPGAAGEKSKSALKSSAAPAQRKNVPQAKPMEKVLEEVSNAFLHTPLAHFLPSLEDVKADVRPSARRTRAARGATAGATDADAAAAAGADATDGAAAGGGAGVSAGRRPTRPLAGSRNSAHRTRTLTIGGIMTAAPPLDGEEGVGSADSSPSLFRSLRRGTTTFAEKAEQFRQSLSQSDADQERDFAQLLSVACTDVQPRELEGWLQKEGGSYKSWKQRYFVLSADLLFYFDKETSKGAKGVVLIDKLSSVQDTHMPGRQFCFAVRTPQRTYNIQAANEAELQKWLKALRAAALKRQSDIFARAKLEQKRKRADASAAARGNARAQTAAPQPLEDASVAAARSMRQHSQSMNNLTDSSRTAPPKPSGRAPQPPSDASGKASSALAAKSESANANGNAAAPMKPSEARAKAKAAAAAEANANANANASTDADEAGDDSGVMKVSGTATLRRLDARAAAAAFAEEEVKRERANSVSAAKAAAAAADAAASTPGGAGGAAASDSASKASGDAAADDKARDDDADKAGETMDADELADAAALIAAAASPKVELTEEDSAARTLVVSERSQRKTLRVMAPPELIMPDAKALLAAELPSLSASGKKSRPSSVVVKSVQPATAAVATTSNVHDPGRKEEAPAVAVKSTEAATATDGTPAAATPVPDSGAAAASAAEPSSSSATSTAADAAQADGGADKYEEPTAYQIPEAPPLPALKFAGTTSALLGDRDEEELDDDDDDDDEDVDDDDSSSSIEDVVFGSAGEEDDDAYADEQSDTLGRMRAPSESNGSQASAEDVPLSRSAKRRSLTFSQTMADKSGHLAVISESSATASDRGSGMYALNLEDFLHEHDEHDSDVDDSDADGLSPRNREQLADDQDTFAARLAAMFDEDDDDDDEAEEEEEEE